MQITRKLASFDLETTGKDVEKDRILEIGIVIMNPDGSMMTKNRIINPGRPIPPEIASIHGIDDSKVKDAPTFEKIAKGLYTLLSDCDLTGYNIAHFDVPMLTAEFNRVGLKWPAPDAKIVDSFSIVNVQDRRTLTWAFKQYVGGELVNAHSALADAQAAMEVLVGQSVKYKAEDLDSLMKLAIDPDWVDSSGKFRYMPDKTVVINFGKHSGTTLHKLTIDYIHWMINAEFPEDVKGLLRDEVDRRKEERAKNRELQKKAEV